MSFAQDETGGVVSLAAHRKGRNGTRPLAQVDAYWHALYSQGGIPVRADISPRGIEGALQHCFVIERVAHHVVRFRVAGHALCDQIGMELRGMPLSALFSPPTREQLRTVLPAIFEQPALCHLELKVKGDSGQPPVSARMIMLPLRGHTGAITHALGAIEVNPNAEAIAGPSPRRFDEMTARLQRVPARVEIGARPDRAEPAQGFAERARPFRPARAPRHLRLIDSDT